MINLICNVKTFQVLLFKWYNTTNFSRLYVIMVNFLSPRVIIHLLLTFFRVKMPILPLICPTDLLNSVTVLPLVILQWSRRQCATRQCTSRTALALCVVLQVMCDYHHTYSRTVQTTLLTLQLLYSFILQESANNVNSIGLKLPIANTSITLNDTDGFSTSIHLFQQRTQTKVVFIIICYDVLQVYYLYSITVQYLQYCMSPFTAHSNSLTFRPYIFTQPLSWFGTSLVLRESVPNKTSQKYLAKSLVSWLYCNVTLMMQLNFSMVLIHLYFQCIGFLNKATNIGLL